MIKECLNALPTFLKDFVYPLIASIIMVWISDKHEIKKSLNEKAPQMQTILLDSPEKLKTNYNTIKECTSYIYISTKEGNIVHGQKEKNRLIEYKRIEYDEFEKQMDYGSPVIFICFTHEGCASLSLNKVQYDTNSIYTIDGKVVPVRNNSKNQYCFLCKKKDMPQALLGKIDNRSVLYNLKFHDCDEKPTFLN